MTMTELAALQAALSGEQQAVYGYGIVGAHLSGQDRSYAVQALSDHQTIRDSLAAMITRLGATPAAADPAYQVPSGSPRDVAHDLELAVAGRFWDVIAAAAAGNSTRAAAIGWLDDAAIRASHWGVVPALPGQPPLPTPTPSS